jgi:ABC-type transport system involved in multi-copper enzyme maturation permease subunit
VADWFPVRHFLLAVFAPFDPRPGNPAFAWHDLLVLAIWGAVALVVALRRFRWEPRRA